MASSAFELFYWPFLQGRGEFVRLAFEFSGTDYLDVARLAESDGGGVPALLKLMNAPVAERPPLAPPFLRHGELVIAQTANILQYLGPRLGLLPGDETSQLWAHQLQLTVMDLIKEVHDTHHPISSSLYYEDQKSEALRYTEKFLDTRLPKYYAYFERVLQCNSQGSTWVVGNHPTYVDTSLFQVVEGMRYAFPNGSKHAEASTPRLVALRDRVAAQANIAAYLASPRRLAFNEMGIFRRYAELDSL